MVVVLARDAESTAWVVRELGDWRRWVGESILTAFGIGARLWVLAGTYSQLPPGVRVGRLEAPEATIEWAGDHGGWVALARASSQTRIAATWRDAHGVAWQRKRLLPLGLLESDDEVTPYGPRMHAQPPSTDER